MNGGLIGQRVVPATSPDAVVLVPGFMGSTLESDLGVLWGGHSLSWYAEAWMDKIRIGSGESPLDELTLTDDERAGNYGRIRATSLLHQPAWAPFLRSLDPYGALVRGITSVMVHPGAVRTFPYDWRLPVAYNATLLETCLREHLDAWRAHTEYDRYRRQFPDGRPAQLVVVAHSMGGLLVRSLPEDLDIRAVVTLGTPFGGAAVAPLVLNSGRGGPVPMPREQLRRMAVTLPGLYDLLPTYRCLDDADHDTDPVRLTPQMMSLIGGDPELAAASSEWHERTAGRRLPGHRPVIGIKQPTDSSLTLKDGVLSGHRFTFDPTPDGLARDAHGILVRRIRDGDGTVPYNSAVPFSAELCTPLAQQHGPLASTQESVDLVCTVLLEGDPDAQRLGGGELGLDLPDIATLGTEITVTISGLSGTTDVAVEVRDELGLAIDHPTVHYADGGYHAVFEPPEGGIYQVVVSGGSTTDLSQRLLVLQPT